MKTKEVNKRIRAYAIEAADIKDGILRFPDEINEVIISSLADLTLGIANSVKYIDFNNVEVFNADCFMKGLGYRPTEIRCIFPKVEKVKAPRLKITENLFMKCEYLREAEIGTDGEIDICGFLCCEKLEKVDISSAKIIGRKAFSQCYNLKEIKTGEQLEEIGLYSFYACRMLKDINIYGAKCVQMCFGECRSLEIIRAESYKSIRTDLFKPEEENVTKTIWLKEIIQSQDITEDSGCFDGPVIYGHKVYEYKIVAPNKTMNCLSLESTQLAYAYEQKIEHESGRQVYIIGDGALGPTYIVRDGCETRLCLGKELPSLLTDGLIA